VPQCQESGLTTGGTSATEERPDAAGSRRQVGPRWDRWGLEPARHWARRTGAAGRPEALVASLGAGVATDQEDQGFPKWEPGAAAG